MWSFDDNLRTNNWFRLAGVSEAILREAYPDGIPDTSFTGTVDLTSDNEEEDIKSEDDIKQEEAYWEIYTSSSSIILY